MDKLSNCFIDFYNNVTYSNSAKEELIKIVYKNITAFTVESKIDMLYMPILMDYINENGLSFDTIKDNLYLVEHLKSGVEMEQNDIVYQAREVYEAYLKAKDVVSKYTKETDSDIEKFAVLYQWMCENVRYDDDALNDKLRMHSEDGLGREKKLELIVA